MKKIICSLMSILMLCTVFCATAFAGTTEIPEATTPAEPPILELEYMDFYENEDYYMNLVIEKDYTLHYNVPAEYEELERARIAKDADTPNGIDLYSIMSPGDYPPTVEKKTVPGTKYYFNGESHYGDRYTLNYYTGATHYVASIHNANSTNSSAQNLKLHVIANGVIPSQSSKYYDEGTTVTKYTMSGNEVTAKKGHFYLCFKGPMTADGYIMPSSAN